MLTCVRACVRMRVQRSFVRTFLPIPGLCGAKTPDRWLVSELRTRALVLGAYIHCLKTFIGQSQNQEVVRVLAPVELYSIRYTVGSTYSS